MRGKCVEELDNIRDYECCQQNRATCKPKVAPRL
jgi:hypothetical protein